MKARPFDTARYKQRAEKLVKDVMREEIQSSFRAGQKHMYLRVIYSLRFDYGWKKRLQKFFDMICDTTDMAHKYEKDHITVAKMVSDLQSAGVDFQGFFDDLEKYEEEEYAREKEIERRGRK